ncbi:hypothetical protein [Micromonospora sp. NPDC047527]|uniref:hypothetical protein n=1 Tax=unclassified Micromonospora TaxID=2617518 RepID=UPI0033FFC0BC
MTLSAPLPALAETGRADPGTAFLVLAGLTMLTVLVSRTRIRSSTLVGTLSAVLPLAVCDVLAASL